jgi:hypothetical protein
MTRAIAGVGLHGGPHNMAVYYLPGGRSRRSERNNAGRCPEGPKHRPCRGPVDGPASGRNDLRNNDG